MNFLRALSPYNLPPSRTPRNEITIQREIILQFTLYFLLLIATSGVVFSFSLFGNPEYMGPITLFFVAYLVLLALVFLRGISYTLRAAAIILLFLGQGLSELFANGIGGSCILMLFIAVVLSNLLFSPWISAFMMLFSTGSVVFAGVQVVTGQVSAAPLNELTNPVLASTWAAAVVPFLFGTLITVTASIVHTGGIRTTVERQTRLAKQIEEEQASLEQRVQERAADLKKRLDQFEVASEIAREISLETSLPALLNNSVNLISQRFQYYQVGVFLNDDRNEYTVLRAAVGPAGQQLMERNHRLKIGEIGIVGNVVSKAEARIAMDVSNDVIHYKNPLLPDTRSEMALPLRFGGRAIGALDVQSVEENAFSQEDLKILQTIADQLAIALAKSQQVEQLQRSMQELEASHAQITQKAWQGHLKTARRAFSYRYRDTKIENNALESAHGKQALSSGKSVMTTITSSDTGHEETVLAIPIKLRNQVLGVIDFHFQSTTVSPDLIALIEGTVDRLAVSLENARLLEEIRYRAERERLVGEISSRVRTASDVDSILQIAAQEIGRSLGVSEVMVQLRSSEQS